MNTAPNITPITLRNKAVQTKDATVVLNKDQWLGECLDDYLFKLCGTDQVVWIPIECIRQTDQWDHAFVARIDPQALFSCARIMISNTIRMCLVDQHQVNGQQLLPYLMESR